jgi:hypothetical protein
MTYQSSIGIKNYQIVIVFCLHYNVLSPLDVSQAVPFSNVVDSLKAMPLTLDACFKLKSFD